MMVTEAMLLAFLLAVIANAMPLLLAALGEMVSEQAGVLNVGVEGVLLLGGFAAFATTHVTGSFWLGFLAGAVAGVVLQGSLVVLSVWLGANQIVVGLGVLLAGNGISSMLYERFFAATRPRLGAAPAWLPAWLTELPILGPVVFAQHGMLLLGVLLTVVIGWFLWRSAPGLRVRVAGQHPATLDAVGGSVTRTRAAATLFGGVMAGVGGAYLALLVAGTFTPGMTHGLGFLTIATAMLAGGRTRALVLIALGYGVLVATGTALQFTAISVPSEVIAMAPFVVALLVIGLHRRSGSGLPPALATSYTRGAR